METGLKKLLFLIPVQPIIIKIAEELGAKVFYRQFDNYANQRNYALKELPITTEWILFLDADEYLTTELKNEIEHVNKCKQY